MKKERILGIDYGKKRVGIAVSDEGNKVAFPHSVLENNHILIKEIIRIAEEKGIKKIVMGESRDFKGEPNKIYDEAKDIKEALEASGMIVIFEPEFLTSVGAERFQGKNDKIDSSAAALILQSYLDRNIE